ncbi:MAG: extracellular solute-binding protein [Oscillospiraceae bacterium]|nr:extracellular solute-binding protein [Oscillospiraceae bacterium]
MKREDLYDAFGNIKDKYIDEARKEFESGKNTETGSESRKKDSSNERTIEISVVRRTKRKKDIKLCLIAAAVLLIGAAAAVAAFMGTEKDNKDTEKTEEYTEEYPEEYKERKINYFTVDTSFDLPDSLSVQCNYAAGKNYFCYVDCEYVPVDTSSDYSGYMEHAVSYLYKCDYEGNIISKTAVSSFGEELSINKIKIRDNGDLVLLVSGFEPEKSEYVSYIIVTDDEFKIKNRINTGQNNILDFIIDNQSRTAYCNSDRLFICDDTGSLRYEMDISYSYPYLFKSENGFYCALVDHHTSKTAVYKIDFDKWTVQQESETDFSFAGILDGCGKYDACINFDDGIFGYSCADNSIEEILNWGESDFDGYMTPCVVPDTDTVISINEKCQILRRTDENRYNGKIILNAATSYRDPDLTELIEEFNNTNSDYVIHIDDYSKYYSSDEYEIYDSGLYALERDIARGYKPDIILFDSYFNLLRYAGKNIFADMDEILSKTDFNRDDYFENIIESQQINGRQNTLPVKFSMMSLAGRKSEFGDKKGLTIDEFSELDDGKMFYAVTYPELTEYLININDFIDTETFTSSFNSESFISLLKTIKNNGISKKEVQTVDILSDEYRQRVAEGMCKFDIMLGINSFSGLSYFQQFNLSGEEPAFPGIPSDKHSGAVIEPELSAAVMADSENKEAAARFIELLISDDGQSKLCRRDRSDNCMVSIPVKKSVYNQLFELESSTEFDYPERDQYGNEINISQKNPDISTREMMDSLISNASAAVLCDKEIKRIIFEQTEKYYSDIQSAEETAENIQNEVSVYLSVLN